MAYVLGLMVFIFLIKWNFLEDYFPLWTSIRVRCDRFTITIINYLKYFANVYVSSSFH